MDAAQDAFKVIKQAEHTIRVLFSKENVVPYLLYLISILVVGDQPDASSLVNGQLDVDPFVEGQGHTLRGKLI